MFAWLKRSRKSNPAPVTGCTDPDCLDAAFHPVEGPLEPPKVVLGFLDDRALASVKESKCRDWSARAAAMREEMAEVYDRFIAYGEPYLPEVEPLERSLHALDGLVQAIEDLRQTYDTII